MTVVWNNCFLCLNDLGKVDGKEAVSNGKRKGKLKVLFRYLLDTRNRVHGSVLENIFQGLEDGGKGDRECGGPFFPDVRLCGNCERLAVSIADLHGELEVVQMKIISGLKWVKEVVRRNSKLYGSNDGARVRLELLEEWLNAEEMYGNRHPNERKMLENLMAFQTAVFEKDKDSVEIPRVFLNKYAYIQHPPHDVVGNLVKPEALDDSNIVEAAIQQELYDDYLLMSFDNACSLEQPIEVEDKVILVPESKPNLRNKVTPSKRKRKKKTDIEISIKSEHSIDEEHSRTETQPIHSLGLEDTDFGTRRRKTRLAASLASERVTEIKYSYEVNSVEKETTGNLKISRTNRTSVAPKPRDKQNVGKIEKNKVSKKKVNRVKGKPLQKSRPKIKLFCESCEFTAYSPYRLEHHLRDHETGEKKFTCDKCMDNRSFSGKQLYQFHMDSHNGANKIHCEICNHNCLSVDIIEHMKSHVEKVFPCPNCSYCSSTREKYLTHLREHGKKGKLWCDLCDLIFHSRHKLLSHLHDKHKAIEKLSCNFDGCDKTFLDIVNLRVHQKIHTQPLICPICQKCFNDPCRLKIHQRAHTGEKPFQCEKCTEAFINNANLQKHLIREHGTEKFKCEVCGNEYTSIQSLHVHRVVHDGTGIPCGFPGCERIFGNKTLWRRHQSFHSTERNFVCEECGFRLKTAARLTKHMLTHKGERKFKCPHCDKAFTMNKYLVNHVRIHTGEKPFVCDLCGKAFNQYAAMYMHKRKHLGDGAPPVNPELGRPRVNRLQNPEQPSVSCRVPTEVSDVPSIDIKL